MKWRQTTKARIKVIKVNLEIATKRKKKVQEKK